MKISCEIIKDLILLYENGEASEESRKLVEEHIAHCPECKALLEQSAEPLGMEQLLSDEDKTEIKAVKNGLGKIKRRWKLSLASVLMNLPMLLIVILTFHQCTGEGIAFTNIDDVLRAKKFMKMIEEEKYTEAAAMLDYTDDYNSIIAAIENQEAPERLKEVYGENPTQEEHAAIRNEKLLEFLEDFKESGYSISNIRFNHVFRSNIEGEDGWQVQIAFTEHGPDDFTQRVIAEFICKNGKITYVSAMEEKRLSAFAYAVGFNHLWNLDEIPEYEEYLEMEGVNFEE